MDAGVLCGETFQTFQVCLTGSPWGYQEHGVRDQEGGEDGRGARTTAKGSPRNLETLWRNHLWEHRHEKGFLSIHGVPQRLLVGSVYSVPESCAVPVTYDDIAGPNKCFV